MVEKIFSISLFIVSVLGYHTAKSFENSFMIDSGLGAGFFPKIICIILGILAVILLLSERKKESYKFTRDNLITLYMILICVGYVVIINKFGYLISTILFSFTIIKLLNKNNFISNLIFSLLFPTGIYLLFSRVFSVSLPVWSL